MSSATKKNLLDYLISKKEASLNDIMLEFGLSRVAVIEMINDINESFGNDVIISNQQGIYMTEQTKMVCYNHFFRGKTKLFDSHESEERYALIIIKVLADQDYSSLQKLADFCLVSKNTILNDMKVIKEILQGKCLDISYSRKKGYTISGSEFNIRNMLVTMIKQLLHLPVGKILLDEKQMINKE